MRKGQTEIIGLVVVIILLIVIGFIYLSFSLMPKQDSAVIRKGVEVSNMLNAILKYTPDGCSGDSVNDIIVDCRSNLPVCGDLNCNSFLATQIRDIIITLIDGRTTYEFAVKDNFA